MMMTIVRHNSKPFSASIQGQLKMFDQQSSNILYYTSSQFFYQQETFWAVVIDF